MGSCQLSNTVFGLKQSRSTLSASFFCYKPTNPLRPLRRMETMAPRQRLTLQQQKLLSAYPWASKPFLVGAPMRVFAGAELAIAVSAAGGLGFIGPTAKPEDLRDVLKKAQDLSNKVSRSGSATLPVGVGFQIWDADLDIAAKLVGEFTPCAVWLFAPRQKSDFDLWINRIRQASPQSQIWIQVGTLKEALEVTWAAKESTRPDVLVMQGTDSGGHGRSSDGIGITTLIPEISTSLDKSGVREIPIIAAGGIADGRGVASALGLGATGVAMGTRFLASTEANLSKGYQAAILNARDGAQSTVRTTLYNQLRGTVGWPTEFSPRTIINRSWIDHQKGVAFDDLKRLHDDAQKKGDAGWGEDGRLATYAGACVGLIDSVEPAAELIDSIRKQAVNVIESLKDHCS